MMKKNVGALSMLVLGACWLLAGCAGPAADVQAAAAEAPTVMPVFRGENAVMSWATPASDVRFRAAPTVAFVFSSQRVPTFTPTPIPTPASTPVPKRVVQMNNTQATQDLDGYRERLIFGDQLDSSWSLEHSQNMRFDPNDAMHAFEVLDGERELNSGTAAIAVTPQDAFASLYFTVRPDATASYPRDRVAGVRFWLHSGDDDLYTDDLAVAVIGSNAQPYWSADDDSVFQDSDEWFSETRLYYLDLNRAVPPNTWVEIEVPLDKLIYDPDYGYVTGFYMKNDAGYRNTFYIDQVALILFAEEE